MAKKKKQSLADIIRANPGCVAQIDNDWWGLLRQSPEANPHWENDDDDAAEKWDEDNRLCDSNTFVGSSSGHCYGGDILEALAEIVGITIEGV